MIDPKKIEKLKEYLATEEKISFAYIFGSYAKKQQISESDIDLAVYYRPAGRSPEWEERHNYPGEDALWLEIEKILGHNTDLVILNRAPAGLAFEILRTGQSLIIKDRKVWLNFLLLISSVAMDFREIVNDWWAIKERSHSLSEEDKQRLLRSLDFLNDELKEVGKFQAISQKEYEQQADKRRNLERWVENIVNASIDIAKIILASEKKPLPETYAGIMESLKDLDHFNEDVAKILAGFTKLRNILAHEYLDLRYNKIKKFIDSAEMVYGELLFFGKKKITT